MLVSDCFVLSDIGPYGIFITMCVTTVDLSFILDGLFTTFVCIYLTVLLHTNVRVYIPRNGTWEDVSNS